MLFLSVKMSFLWILNIENMYLDYLIITKHMQYWKTTIYRENILEKISIEWENAMLSYLARLRSLADLERDGDFFLRSRDLDLKGTLVWQNRFFLSYLIIHLKPPVFLESSISTSNLPFGKWIFLGIGEIVYWY